MFGIVDYGIFVLAAVTLNITPGADTIYILGRSIGQGKQAGLISVLGISSGSIIHTLLAALGLSVILAKSVMAFNLIKVLGAGYLIYLGVKALTAKEAIPLADGDNDSLNLSKVYLQGIMTNVLNPKVALFFLAFLPQFIDPAQSYGALPFLLLGLTFITTGTIWCLLLVVFSSFLTERIRSQPKVSTLLNKITGAMLIGLGLNLLRAKAN